MNRWTPQLATPALLFRTSVDEPVQSVGLLVIRVVAGSAMMLHGLPKLLMPTRWMGEDTVPALLQLLAAVAEFGGGLAWVLGLLTPLASLGIIITMGTGILLAHIPGGDPLIRLTVTGDASGLGAAWAGLPVWLVKADGRGAMGSGSSELALLFIGIGGALLSAGAGRFSLDGLLARRRKARAVAPA